MSKSSTTLPDVQINVENWSVTRRRFRPALSDRIFRMLSFIPSLTHGPKTSLRERHVLVFPHLLSLDVTTVPGTYEVRQTYRVRKAECLGQPVSSTDLDMLTQRLWHTQETRMCTELNDNELESWKTLSSAGLTLSFQLIPISLSELM